MKIGYQRVSTSDQRPEVQEDRLKADGCEIVFTDKGVSGMKASRPGWDECLSRLSAGDTLVVVRLDRIGRSVRNLIDVVSTLRARGVELRVLDQGIDTSTPAGKLLFHVIAAIAEFERDVIRERTMDGLARSRSEGRTGGAKPKLSPAQAAEVRKMFSEGRNPRDIGELFGISRASVYRYAGEPAA